MLLSEINTSTDYLYDAFAWKLSQHCTAKGTVPQDFQVMDTTYNQTQRSLPLCAAGKVLYWKIRGQKYDDTVVFKFLNINILYKI